MPETRWPSAIPWRAQYRGERNTGASAIPDGSRRAASIETKANRSGRARALRSFNPIIASTQNNATQHLNSKRAEAHPAVPETRWPSAIPWRAQYRGERNTGASAIPDGSRRAASIENKANRSGRARALRSFNPIIVSTQNNATQHLNSKRVEDTRQQVRHHGRVQYRGECNTGASALPGRAHYRGERITGASAIPDGSRRATSIETTSIETALYSPFPPVQNRPGTAVCRTNFRHVSLAGSA